MSQICNEMWTPICEDVIDSLINDNNFLESFKRYRKECLSGKSFWINLAPNPNITWDWDVRSMNQLKHERFVKEHLTEELVKYAYHPKRIMKYLEMGYEPDELDDVM